MDFAETPVPARRGPLTVRTLGAILQSGPFLLGIARAIQQQKGRDDPACNAPSVRVR